MTYKESVWKEIREKSPLRMKIGVALGVGEKAVELAEKRRSTSLTRYAAVKVISAELGIPEDELFETEPA